MRHKVTIVNYHDPDPVLFECHLRFYLKHYSIINIEQLVDVLYTGTWSELPPKSLVITFDDGHVGNARLFSTLRKYHIPTLIYATAGLVDTKRKFWWKVLPPRSSRKNYLKNLKDDDRRDWLGKKYNHTDKREYNKRYALDKEQIKDYIDSGGTLGSHTMFHPILDKCDEATARFELEESKKILERNFNTTVRHFAYPDGKWTEQVRKLTKQVGYVTARTIDIGWITKKSDPLALPNLGINDYAGINRAIVQVSGLWHILRALIIPKGLLG